MGGWKLLRRAERRPSSEEACSETGVREFALANLNKNRGGSSVERENELEQDVGRARTWAHKQPSTRLQRKIEQVW